MIIKHHIIVKWNETVTDKTAIIKPIKELFDKALEIEGINAVDLFPNVIARDNRYDLMIVITMSEEALPIYDSSAYHLEWKNDYGKRIASKAIFDMQA